MGNNGNKKKKNSTNEIDLAKNGVYCNDLMLKTMFIKIVLKIKQYKNIILVNFRELKHGMYQDYNSLPRIA